MVGDPPQCGRIPLARTRQLAVVLKSVRSARVPAWRDTAGSAGTRRESLQESFHPPQIRAASGEHHNLCTFDTQCLAHRDPTSQSGCWERPGVIRDSLHDRRVHRPAGLTSRDGLACNRDRLGELGLCQARTFRQCATGCIIHRFADALRTVREGSGAGGRASSMRET
jgi:hypothetical protein